MLLYYQIQKKQSNNNKCETTKISDVNGDNSQVSAFGKKPGIINTGVHVCYHNLTYYEKISKPHQDEIRDWINKTNEGNGGKVKAMNPNTNTEFNNRTENYIASAVIKRVTEQMKALDQDKDNGKQVEACIMSIIQKASENHKASVSSATGSTTTIIVPGTLKSIIK